MRPCNNDPLFPDAEVPHGGVRGRWRCRTFLEKLLMLAGIACVAIPFLVNLGEIVVDGAEETCVVQHGVNERPKTEQRTPHRARSLLYVGGMFFLLGIIEHHRAGRYEERFKATMRPDRPIVEKEWCPEDNMSETAGADKSQ